MERVDTSDNDKNVLILLDNDQNNRNRVIKMEIEKKGYLFDITEFILDKNYTLTDALDILMEKLLTDNDDKEKRDIDINDDDFFIGDEIVNRVNKNINKNVVLKFFDFYPKGHACDKYFIIQHPNFKEF